MTQGSFEVIRKIQLSVPPHSDAGNLHLRLFEGEGGNILTWLAMGAPVARGTTAGNSTCKNAPSKSRWKDSHGHDGERRDMIRSHRKRSKMELSALFGLRLSLLSPGTP
jgi:hypothetical protein